MLLLSCCPLTSDWWCSAVVQIARIFSDVFILISIEGLRENKTLIKKNIYDKNLNSKIHGLFHVVMSIGTEAIQVALRYQIDEIHLHCTFVLSLPIWIRLFKRLWRIHPKTKYENSRSIRIRDVEGTAAIVISHWWNQSALLQMAPLFSECQGFVMN